MRLGKKTRRRARSKRPDPMGTARLSSTSIGPPLPSVMRPHKVSGMAAAARCGPGAGVRLAAMASTRARRHTARRAARTPRHSKNCHRECRRDNTAGQRAP